MKKIQNIYDNPMFFEKYLQLRSQGNNFNNSIEQPAMRALLPDLTNKIVLDIGCGAGEFCRYMLNCGALLIRGIDPSLNMIKLAEKSYNSAIHYQQIAVEDFEAVANSFDLIVSSVVLHYIADYDALVKKIAQWLKPDGIFLFSIEHPICTAHPNMSLKTDERDESFHPMYNYRDEGMFSQTWFVEGVQKYHRKVSTYINTLITHGFTIEVLSEPMPDENLIKQEPAFAIHKIRPPLLIIKAKLRKDDRLTRGENFPDR